MSIFQISSAKLRKFWHLLQTARDQEIVGITETLIITVDKTQSTFMSHVWTSAMTRDFLDMMKQTNSI